MLLEIETENLVADFQKIKEHMDFSNLHCSHPLYSTENKDVPGKFKSEVRIEDIAEFIGLRSKLYSLKMVNGTCKKAAAGVKKSIAQRDLTH